MTNFIFDIDGTLIDSNDLHAKAWEMAFRAIGLNVPFAKIRAQIGKGSDQLLPEFLGKEEIERQGKKISGMSGEIFKREYLGLVRPFPKVRELFNAIREKGGRIALASSGKEDEVEQYKIIAQISDLVESSTSSDDAQKSKSQPDIFHAAMRQLSNPPAQSVLVVGDSPYDAIAAKRAHLTPGGVLCGGFALATLNAAGCRTVYKDPADLLVNLESLFKRAY